MVETKPLNTRYESWRIIQNVIPSELPLKASTNAFISPAVINEPATGKSPLKMAVNAIVKRISGLVSQTNLKI
jgi:hypothetical protein